ncbi:MAG: ATPase domain-containing protein [Candidatus Micrarchaeota archaeon]
MEKRSGQKTRNGKVKSGVMGLDALIDGGIPPKSVVLVSGPPGSGKTIFCLQFIAQGAIGAGEKGLYLTFEEWEDKIVDQAAQFGWDFRALEKKGLLRIASIRHFTLGSIYSEVMKEIKDFKPKRLVMDSLTYFNLAASTRHRIVDLQEVAVDEAIYGGKTEKGAALEERGMPVRKAIIDLVGILQSKDICTLATSEISRNSEWYSRDTLSEFACDGIIHLKSTAIGDDVQRTLEVVKMRNTKVKGGIHAFEFTSKGVRIKGSK